MAVTEQLPEVVQLARRERKQSRSEARFRLALRRSADAIVIIDPSRDRIVEANTKACRLLGYPRSEIINCELKAIHPIDMPELREFMKAVIRQGCGWTDELSCTSREGEVIPAEISASAVKVRDKTHVVAIVRSVSERKAREEFLQHSAKELEEKVQCRTSELRAANLRLELEVSQRRLAEQKLRDLLRRHQLILDSAGEGILGTDIQGKATFVNSDAASLLGRSLTDVIGIDVLTLFKRSTIIGSDSESDVGPLEDALANGNARRLEEAIVLRRDGGAVPVELRCTPVRDGSDLAGVVVVFRDISKRKRHEQSLRTALAENECLKQRVEAENVYLREELHSNHEFREVVARSDAIAQVLRQVGMVAPTDANVLVTGESGTGKELIARAIHDLSARKAGPFIKVNCAAIPRDLFESEFFGHVRGAFTGAHSNRTGRFELANGGTLFLDEIGELPLELQTKLLGVLQEGRFERVGDGKSLSVDVRVIAATNRDLEVEIAAKRFRLDLFYRLNIFPIVVPPLRERSEDIVPLAEYFLRSTSRRLRRGNLQLSEEHHRQLIAYDWPGNVREMQNVIERAVILVRGGQQIRFDVASRLPAAANAVDSNQAFSDQAISQQVMPVERERQRRERDIRNIENALRHTRGRIAGSGGAAELLGVKPSTLRSRIKVYGISPKPLVVEENLAN
jgi:PAS domain S-box-containing protein